MAKFVKGDVVVIPFPFSDLTNVKKRPALVISPLDGADIILCQITSKARSDGYSIPLRDSDFESGGLKVESNVRPNRLFTADKGIILYKVGRISGGKIEQVTEKIIEIIRSR